MKYRKNCYAMLFSAALSLFSLNAVAAVKGRIVTEAEHGKPSQIMEFSTDGTLTEVTGNRTNIQISPGFGEVPDLSRPQKVLVLLVGPEYQARKLDEIRELFEGSGPKSLKNFYGAQSSGAVSFASFSYVSVPAPGYNGCPLLPHIQLARYSDVTGDRALDFDHVFFLGAYDAPKCNLARGFPGAIATLGKMQVDNQHGSYRLTASWYPDNFMTDEYAVNHEFGHQIGWFHSGRSSDFTHDEYGDSSDVMGGPYTQDYNISAVRKWTQGWQTRGVRTVRANEFGQSLLISLNKNPELILVPLKVANIKRLYMGRIALALSFEGEVRTPSNDLPWRRAGVLPRLVSTGLPEVSTSTLVASIPSPAQLLPDLVLDTVGTYNLAEAGLTLIVDEVTPLWIRMRIFDNNPQSFISIASAATPVGVPCYHRYFKFFGTQPIFITAQKQLDGRFEELKTVRLGNDSGVAQFVGAEPYVVNAVIETRRGYAYVSQEIPGDASCDLVVPKLSVKQARDGNFFSRNCNVVNVTANNMSGANNSIYGALGGNAFKFKGSGNFSFLGIDNRTIAPSTWSDDTFPILVNANVAPVDCQGSIVPKLTITPLLGNDCKTIDLTVTQSAPGVIGALAIHTFGVNDESNRVCITDSGLQSASCSVAFDSSLDGKKLTVTSQSASDMVGVQTELRCSSP